MAMTANPKRFAETFNQECPGAYQTVTADDIRLMTECGIIGHYGCYGDSDIRTIVGVFRYELLREKRIEKLQPNVIPEIRKCKICGNPLPNEPVSKHGRRKEFCTECESLRVRMRHRKWKERQQVKRNSMTSLVQLRAF